MTPWHAAPQASMLAPVSPCCAPPLRWATALPRPPATLMWPRAPELPSCGFWCLGILGFWRVLDVFFWSFNSMTQSSSVNLHVPQLPWPRSYFELPNLIMGNHKKDRRKYTFITSLIEFWGCPVFKPTRLSAFVGRRIEKLRR